MAASSADDDFVAEINVTPFVDVMLVLLVIFMVTAPMMTEGLDVALPKVESSEVLPTENDHVILTITSEGSVFLDQYETGMDDLVAVVREHVKSEGKQLFVRADQTVPYGTVMNVMDRLRGAGIEDVGLVTTSAFDGDAADAVADPDADVTGGAAGLREGDASAGQTAGRSGLAEASGPVAASVPASGEIGAGSVAGGGQAR